MKTEYIPIETILFSKTIDSNIVIIAGDCLKYDMCRELNLSLYIGPPVNNITGELFCQTVQYGTIGIRGLLEVKKQLCYIITWAFNCLKIDRIAINPTDNKRFNAYRRLLEKLGFNCDKDNLECLLWRE